MTAKRRRQHLLTAEVAAAVGVHPNTVRLYEHWGFIPPVPRSPKGYRLYSEWHVDLLRLARLALRYPYPGGKQPVLDMVAAACSGDLSLALTHALDYRRNIEREYRFAEDAAAVLENWAAGPHSGSSEPVSVSQAAATIGVSADALRNWERNGLISVPRHPESGYRQYGAMDVERLRVIRVLQQAGYSTMAILRVLLYLDAGRRDDLRAVLGTPPLDEDVLYITDRWLATLSEQQERADSVIALVHAIALKRRQGSYGADVSLVPALAPPSSTCAPARDGQTLQ